jgi:hypothetical protein
MEVSLKKMEQNQKVRNGGQPQKDGAKQKGQKWRPASKRWSKTKRSEMEASLKKMEQNKKVSNGGQPQKDGAKQKGQLFEIHANNICLENRRLLFKDSLCEDYICYTENESAYCSNMFILLSIRYTLVTYIHVRFLKKYLEEVKESLNV